MTVAELFLKQRLNERVENGLFRQLTINSLPFDFCSNDYLGFANSAIFSQMIVEECSQLNNLKNGSSGSRLLSGNHPYTEETEQLIANFHNAQCGLIFNSGYDANVGLLSSVPQRGDTIITDELIHASLIDGARLSYADRFKFKHNDLIDLEIKLKNAKGIVYVVIESVYSMDGDIAPIVKISELCNDYSANLIVDEAHATGIFGYKGSGLVSQLKLEKFIFARIVTFGKAIGAHGAIILGSNNLRNYLINFAKSFIYTTAAPLHQIAAINCAYQLLSNGSYEQVIQQKITLYTGLIGGVKLPMIKSESAIQTLLFNTNEGAKNAENYLKSKNYDVKAILSPSVPKGKERLRICLHTFNSDQEITSLVKELKLL